MSQEKAQLIAPIENITVTGVVATGVITATSFEGNVTGSASSIIQGANIVAGIVTAGLNTTTAFSGNLTGNAGGLSGDPDIHVGVLSATSFVGNVTGIVTGRATGLSNTGAGTSNLNIGTFTATTFHGDGSGLSGVAGAAFSQQSIGITSATTAIDLSNGNVIHANQSANTTVSFANTAGSNEIYFIREKDATTTARTITWPPTIEWDGGTTPTLISANDSGEAQIFKLCTTTNGETWYGKEVYKNEGGYRMFMTGYNYRGAMGLNVGAPFPSATGSGSRSSPTQVSGAWSSVFKAGANNAQYAIKTDGTLWAWGENAMGQLAQNDQGDNDATSRSSPVQIGTKNNWVKGAKWSQGAMATNTEGELWSWGYGGKGTLGQNLYAAGGPSSRSSPVQVPGNTWDQITGGGSDAVFSIKTNGTLWCWGGGFNGVLGLNQPVGAPGYGSVSSPTQIGTEGTWATINMGQYVAWATKTNGTLWTWGLGSYGQLGLNQGPGAAISSPTQVGTDTNWGITETTVSGNSGVSCYSVKQNGELWSWGYNWGGQLGINDRIPRSSPVQVSGTTWSTISSDGSVVLAGKTDGTFWSWGYNNYGKLGFNISGPTGNLSSPTQIPGTWQGIVSLGTRSTGAFKS